MASKLLIEPNFNFLFGTVSLFYSVSVLVFVTVFIDAGSRNELPHKPGITHLLSRVAIEVTLHYIVYWCIYSVLVCSENRTVFR